MHFNEVGKICYSSGNIFFICDLFYAVFVNLLSVVCSVS